MVNIHRIQRKSVRGDLYRFLYFHIVYIHKKHVWHDLQRAIYLLRSGKYPYNSMIKIFKNHPCLKILVIFLYAIQTIACSLVSSHLDYANSLFVGVSDLGVKRLQRIQNSLARVVLCVPVRTCSSVLLHQLHWLPVEFRIRFKLACLA